MKRLEGWTIRFTRIVALAGLLALLILAGIILANALGSWLFTAPIDGVRDWIKLIVAIAIGACIPAALAMRQNITIRFLGRLAGSTGNKVLELFGACLTLVAIAAIAWQLQIYVFELFKSGETTENLGMPIGPWWQIVTILFYLSTLVQLLVVLIIVASLGRKERLRDDANSAMDPQADPRQHGA
ncbi:MAG TPA: TRAP transporter small permease subunit [Alphaproteobacteria bacterium]|nr:TRAP transporter small permease subunit [Alphaproteobacteria bacterium]